MYGECLLCPLYPLLVVIIDNQLSPHFARWRNYHCMCSPQEINTVIKLHGERKKYFFTVIGFFFLPWKLISRLQRADISASLLTINSERLKILEFSKPFMQFTMSLITKKLHTNDHDLTTFMLPYSTEVWLLTLMCLLLVAVLMYLVNFFSPYGHRSRHRHRHLAETGEEFDFYNSLWFCLASMLQQGADQTPKSFSGDF